MAKKAGPKPPLPKSLTQIVPTAAKIVKLADDIAKLLPSIQREMKAAEHKGAIPLARAFVVLHRLNEVVGEKLAPFAKIVSEFKDASCPEALEAAGITSVPLDEGYRVGVSYNMRVSMKGDNKTAEGQALRAKAMAYIRKHYPDVISETVNASTLSSLARDLAEANKELPEELFNVAYMPTTSVTGTGA